MRNKTEKELKQCKDAEDCPLKIDHPKNGNEFALGCSLCREVKQNVKKVEGQENEEEEGEKKFLEF